MEFLVIGRDAATFGFGPDELHERHQTYMDSWSGRFIARGPLLSHDGGRHEGSLHIVSAADMDTACRFALDEPYALAGWYADIAVSPFVSCLEGTMWERPVPNADRPSTFVQATWAPQVHEKELVERLADLLAREDPPWLFAGIVVNADASRSVGLAAGVDLPQHQAADRTRTALAAATRWSYELGTDRWRRGGRPSP